MVQSLRVIEGSSEVAMEAAAAPPPMAVAAIATFAPARHRDLATILNALCLGEGMKFGTSLFPSILILGGKNYTVPNFRVFKII